MNRPQKTYKELCNELYLQLEDLKLQNVELNKQMQEMTELLRKRSELLEKLRLVKGDDRSD